MVHVGPTHVERKEEGCMLRRMSNALTSGNRERRRKTRWEDSEKSAWLKKGQEIQKEREIQNFSGDPSGGKLEQPEKKKGDI